MSNSATSGPGIVGAAIVPHAPQFLTLPETEDHAQVARVNAAMRELGDRFRALDPDLLIDISNAHCDDFVVRCVPAFAIHCGARAQGSGGHEGWWPVDGQAGGAFVCFGPLSPPHWPYWECSIRRGRLASSVYFVRVFFLPRERCAQSAASSPEPRLSTSAIRRLRNSADASAPRTGLTAFCGAFPPRRGVACGRELCRPPLRKRTLSASREAAITFLRLSSNSRP